MQQPENYHTLPQTQRSTKKTGSQTSSPTKPIKLETKKLAPQYKFDFDEEFEYRLLKDETQPSSISLQSMHTTKLNPILTTNEEQSKLLTNNQKGLSLLNKPYIQSFDNFDDQNVNLKSSQSPLKIPSINEDAPKLSNVNSQYKIFVGGLPHTLEDDKFKEYFQKFGEMEDCIIMRDKRTWKPRGFGFITYKDVESVVQVINMHDKHFIEDKWIDCKSAIPFEEIKLIEQQQQELKSKNNLINPDPVLEQSPVEFHQIVTDQSFANTSFVEVEESQIKQHKSLSDKQTSHLLNQQNMITSAHLNSNAQYYHQQQSQQLKATMVQGESYDSKFNQNELLQNVVANQNQFEHFQILEDHLQNYHIGQLMMVHQLNQTSRVQQKDLQLRCNSLIQEGYLNEQKNDYEFNFAMNQCDQESRNNVDYHIDKLNFDYMTEEEKIDMSNSTTSTLPWSHNKYQNTPSKDSFNCAIFEKQNLLEDNQSFNQKYKSVDWSNFKKQYDLQNRQLDHKLLKSIFSGFMTSINEQIIDQFDHSNIDKRENSAALKIEQFAHQRKSNSFIVESNNTRMTKSPDETKYFSKTLIQFD